LAAYVSIKNINAQEVMKQEVIYGKYIDIESLEKGIYLTEIFDIEKNLIRTTRFIKH
jgi:hypothetical protein